jgi:hypothetical protein
MRTAAGCQLLTDYKTRDGIQKLAVKTEIIPDEGCIEWDGRTPEQVVKESCADWPQNEQKPRLGKTGDCCWQWVDGD